MPRWASGPVGMPPYWDRAIRELGAADPILKTVISGCGEGGLTGQNDPFITLARSIVGQQISVRAADSIWGRLELAVTEVAPAHVVAAGPEKLRAAGLTNRKSSYVCDIAAAFVDGQMGPHIWQDQADEVVIDALCELRGVGRWTAEMFLIFHLLRPDVLPLADIGLRRAVAINYRDDGDVSPEDVDAIAEAWRPWRSVATWHLWRSLDPVPVTY
ncbi:MAG: DNA-3-methyladenine glycosylase 2 family protein [Alphaproteobacteria bacterium]|jgi:DNA-3-methyladenine glycosylase II|nr:DNA-3-methyladenine glycosylase 2 family protein [Alphaproteobacteria bacterium]